MDIELKQIVEHKTFATGYDFNIFISLVNIVENI